MTVPEIPHQIPPPPPPKRKLPELPPAAAVTPPAGPVAPMTPPDVPPAILAGGRKSGLGLDPVVVPAWTPPDEAPEATLYRELGRAADGPGEMFNMMSKKHLEDVRGKYEDEPPAKGVRYTMVEGKDGPRAQVNGFDDIPKPGGGSWDPTQFAPHYVFDAKEDAFPVRPDFDGDADTGNNGAGALEDTGSDHYRDGVIDGQQALNSAFVVQQKGEYTVLTYSNYYATNKGAHYHKNDYSTAQVYLKPNAEGKLEPAFLATSWHYGTVLTPWKDVKKDAQGHPVIGVGLGTHSLQPYGTQDAIPRAGLHVFGDGSTALNGIPTGQRLTYDAFQTNVANATVVPDDCSDRAVARRTTLGYGWAAADPLHPSTFTKDNTQDAVEDRLEGDLEAIEAHGGPTEDAARKAVLEGAEKVERSGEDVPETFWEKILPWK